MPRPDSTEDPNWNKKFCSVYEIAQLMGVTKGRVSQYTNDPWFPKPIDTLRTGRIWSYPQVVAAWTAHKASQTRHRPPADIGTPTPEENP